MLRSIDFSQFKGGSAVPTLNRNHVHEYQLYIPQIAEQNKFAERVTSLHLLIKSKETENLTLNLMRDYLLPKLMYGELDVSEIAI